MQNNKRPMFNFFYYDNRFRDKVPFILIGFYAGAMHYTNESYLYSLIIMNICIGVMRSSSGMKLKQMAVEDSSIFRKGELLIIQSNGQDFPCKVAYVGNERVIVLRHLNKIEKYIFNKLKNYIKLTRI